jgi:peptidoglycan/xylan/chitin deacetylase (PgdA/CDA1 family)
LRSGAIHYYFEREENMSARQILLVLILVASMAGIALSDTNNTQVKNNTPTATAICDSLHNPCGNITPLAPETPAPISTVADIPNETVTATPIPSPNVTITPTPAPTQNQRATVILTFDDGWLTAYTKAYPILKANNQSGVAFVNVEPILGGWPDFMSKTDLDIMYNSGWDISSHTYSHADLTTLNDSALKHELNDTEIWLDNSGYVNSSMFLAYPYGAYNNTVINALKIYGYAAARTIDTTTTYTHYKLRSPDIYMMKNYEAIGGIDNDVTIINQIHNASAVNGLLILSFHKIVDNLSLNETDAEEEFKVSDFQNVSNYLKSSGVDVRTLSEYLGTKPKVIPIVNSIPVVNTTVIPVSPAASIVTSTHNLAKSKYTSESGGGSPGGNHMDYVPVPPRSIPTPAVTRSPVPTETVDFNNYVVTGGSGSVRNNPSNAEVPQVKEKGLFESIKEFLVNLWNAFDKLFIT